MIISSGYTLLSVIRSARGVSGLPENEWSGFRPFTMSRLFVIVGKGLFSDSFLRKPHKYIWGPVPSDLTGYDPLWTS